MVAPTAEQTMADARAAGRSFIEQWDIEMAAGLRPTWPNTEALMVAQRIILEAAMDEHWAKFLAARAQGRDYAGIVIINDVAGVRTSDKDATEQSAAMGSTI